MNRLAPVLCTPSHARRGSVRTERVGLALALPTLTLVGGGCAERGLITRPTSPPSGVAWAAVWLAGALASVVLGLLLTLPAWRARGGARVATAVLGVQSGTVAVIGIVLTGVALRSWQLVGHAADAPPATALVRLSRVDGDQAFFALMVIGVTVLSALLVVLTASAAQLAAATDPGQRLIASAVLAVELAGAGYMGVRLLLGSRGLPYALSGMAIPVLGLALASCWPRRGAPSPLQTGYNSGHG